MRVACTLFTFVHMNKPRRPNIVSFRVTPRELAQLEKCRRPDERLSECARRLLFDRIPKRREK